MGSVDLTLASELKNHLGLQRAVETGTYRGKTARSLSRIFGSVVTIELSEDLHAAAVKGLADVPAIQPLQGHSVPVLREIADPAVPTFFFLDGHWSAGVTAGADDECPVLEEIAAIGAGHPDDCLVIDDARLFTAAPPPPHDPTAWPTIIEVFDAVRGQRPDHFVTLLNDQVLAVPPRAKATVNAYAYRVEAARESVVDRAKGAAFRARERLAGRG